MSLGCACASAEPPNSGWDDAFRRSVRAESSALNVSDTQLAGSSLYCVTARNVLRSESVVGLMVCVQERERVQLKN